MNKTDELLALIATILLTGLDFKYAGYGEVTAKRKIEELWKVLHSLVSR